MKTLLRLMALIFCLGWPGLAWATTYNAATYASLTHPAGDGVTNDEPAIQTDLNWVGSHGGGVLLLPNDSYFCNNTSGGLVIGANTILEGASEAGTVLLFNTATQAAFAFNNGSSSGIWDLTATDTAPVIAYPYTNAGHGFIYNYYNSGTNLTLENDRFNLGAAKWISLSGIQGLTITGCYIAANSDPFGALFACGDLGTSITNNTILTEAQRIELNHDPGLIFTGNDVIKNPGPGISGGGGHIESSSGIQISYDNNAVVTGNTFDTPGLVDVSDNDEECITTQHDAGSGEPFHDVGQLSSATSTTITDCKKTWAATSWAVSNNGTYTNDTPYLLIVSGAGTGEYALVSSHTGNTVTLATPLIPVPSPGDRYVIFAPSSLNQTISNNTIVGARVGIELYAGAIGDTVSDNTLVNAGGILLRGYDTSTDAEHDVLWDNVVTYNAVSNPDSVCQSYVAADGQEFQSTAQGNLLMGNTVQGDGAALAPGGAQNAFFPTGDFVLPVDGVFDGITEAAGLAASHGAFVAAADLDSGQE